ncbi:hypothetical protein [Sediminibacterium sp.]|uniref:hypothetical protein n=1 Tax=Sediminibacterium sp. TaxID=1917865 RepID=UPI00273210DC|nr:hypothetical protein [Sediminibacterium sp.]MDP1973559.1 hypothetical protein [Sediminibacterium sp.]MDP2422492.1 hypothetical protein [Sediminibacterium sp.]
MKLKISLFISFLSFATILFSQQMNVLECKYQITVTDKDGSHVAIRTYLVAEDKILSFIENDSSRVTLADFKNQSLKIKSTNGGIHSFKMQDSRSLVSIETKRDSINGFIGDYLITSFAGEENVFLIVDSSIKIPKFDGNDFFDVFDNGFGFLPIKGVKETISPVAGHGKITWTISLLSKKSSLVNISLFNIE